MIISNPVASALMIVLLSVGFGVIAKDDFERGTVNTKPLIVSVAVLLFIGSAIAEVSRYGTPGYEHPASDFGPTYYFAGVVAGLGMFVAPFFLIILGYYFLGYVAWNITGRKRIQPVAEPEETDVETEASELPTVTEPPLGNPKPSAPAFGKRNYKRAK